MTARRWICTAAVLGALVLGGLGWSRPTAAQCMDDWHCLWQEWIVDCVGDWDCIDFDCVENCDDHQCGNGICDALHGESMESCAYDCVAPTCVEPSNCIGQDWTPYCQGHWDCVEGECVPICDFETCGDGYCDPAGGESFFSCMDDCWLGCDADIDCIDYPWPVDCGGNWDCYEGFCVPNCDDDTCGDGFCDRQAGESDESCPLDCFGLTCEVDMDCLQYEWLVDCWGHWDCVEGFCVERCNEICGDGECEPWEGEGATTCAPDCEWQCAEDIHCFHEPWLWDCVGHWDCLSGLCMPNCEDIYCGNGACDYLEGESSQSCSMDCPPCICGDLDYSGGCVDLNDFATLALCFGLRLPERDCAPRSFVASDMDASRDVALADFATFAILYGRISTQSPPNCLELE